MAFIRKNAWNNGGTFDNLDLLWYAKAVGVMKSRPVSDATSWWFYGAIHGQALAQTEYSGKIPTGFPNWKNIPAIPASALATLPPSDKMNIFWDQCQHGTWFFLPWHRGYLAALENILRDIIVNVLKGPADWALPYWDYLETQNQIPPAFMELTLPDGWPNPLYIPERYGPQGNNDIYIVVGSRAANNKCQSMSEYTSPVNAYGGHIKTSKFRHFHGDFGAIEKNPHNFVHLMVGSWKSNYRGRTEGLMTDPDTAALDPIFFIHHSNIDRMWAAWNETGKNPNPTNARWLEQPNGIDQRYFAMPMDAEGKEWRFTPKDVNSTTINYNGKEYAFTYEDLSLPSGALKPSASPLHQRLMRFGVDKSEKDLTAAKNNESGLVGGNSGSLTLDSGITKASVLLDQPSWKSVLKSLSDASSGTALPDEIYLQLEDVKSVHNSNFLSVYVNDIYVETVALFGIRKASMKHSAHGGSGLTFRFNISRIIDDMHLAGAIDVASLHVKIETELGGSEITVGQISVYHLKQ